MDRGLGRAGKAGERDLGDVDEPGALFILERAEDHALGHGGDEAADICLAGKEWHGVAVSLGGGFYGVPVIAAFVFGQGEGAIPGFAAAFYGKKRGPKGAFRRRRRHDFYL